MSEPSTGPAGPGPADAAASQPIEVGHSPFGLTGTDDTVGRQQKREQPFRTRTIVLSILLAVSLAAAAGLGYKGWRVSSQKDATLTVPKQVAGLTMDESENGRQTAEYLANALSADVDFDKAVGAVYTDPAAVNRGVLFFGGTTLFWTPGRDLDSAFELISDDQGVVTGLRGVDAGPLRGTMKCGSTRSDDGDISVCGWADHGSLALALFPNRSLDESADLMRQIRTATQSRG